MMAHKDSDSDFKFSNFQIHKFSNLVYGKENRIRKEPEGYE